MTANVAQYAGIAGTMTPEHISAIQISLDHANWPEDVLLAVGPVVWLLRSVYVRYTICCRGMLHVFEKKFDKVAVLASFGHKSGSQVEVRPHYLKWRGRRYHIDVMGLHHVAKRGEKRIHVFGFSSGTNDFTVELDPETLEWTLVEVYYGA